MPPGAASDDPVRDDPDALGGEQECPCGSGRPFAVCHGVDELVDAGGPRAEDTDAPGDIEAAPARPAAPAIDAEQECICGSGKPFNQCHGKVEEADGGDSGSQEAQL